VLWLGRQQNCAQTVTSPIGGREHYHPNHFCISQSKASFRFPAPYWLSIICTYWHLYRRHCRRNECNRSLVPRTGRTNLFPDMWYSILTELQSPHHRYRPSRCQHKFCWGLHSIGLGAIGKDRLFSVLGLKHYTPFYPSRRPKICTTHLKLRHHPKWCKPAGYFLQTHNEFHL